MTRIPSSWQRELAIQKKLRQRLTDVQRKHQALVKERLRILKVGGRGWASALAKVNIQIEREWERQRVLLLKLYSRKVVV